MSKIQVPKLRRAFAAVLVALAAAGFTAHGADAEKDARKDADKVQIDPHELRARIRAELLRHTPPGSSTRDVLAFVRTRLQHEGDLAPVVENHPATGVSAGKSGKKGVKVVTVILSDYLESPILLTLQIPLPLRSTLVAQWAFDKDGRLVEIFLDRVPQPSASGADARAVPIGA
jgi:hypothetical protein